MINEIKFEGGSIELSRSGILKFTTSVDKLELVHAQNLLKSVGSLEMNSDPLLLLLDAKSLKEGTSSKVKSLTVNKLEGHVGAMAVLKNSPISRFLIHTFLAMYQPKIPIKMFEDESKAREWLLRSKGQN
jgi:hypothetical protein